MSQLQPSCDPHLLSNPSVFESIAMEQQALLDSAGVGIVFIRKRHIVRCNHRYAEMFGYENEAKMVGVDCALLYPDLHTFRKLGREAYAVLAEGGIFRSERPLLRKDGQIFWGSLTGRLLNAQDTGDGSIWILDDVNARKNAEVQLDAVRKEKQLLFDAAMVGIAFVLEQKLTHCNHHFETMLGYGPGELIGQSTSIWYENKSIWHEVEHKASAVTQRGDVFEDTLHMQHNSGSRIVCEVRSKLIDAHHPQLGAIWICMDVTERYQAQEDLSRVHSELEVLVQQRTLQLRETVDSLHREIRERKRDQDRIYWLAHYDALTGLPNRTLLAERSTQAIEHARRTDTSLAVVFLDLDHFKQVNDSLGHRVGDALLVAIARRLRAIVRDKDTVCRLGGDEFILLLPGANARGVRRVAEKLQEASRIPYQIDNHELTMAHSMGMALFPDNGEDIEALIQAADVAMYHAKLDGRNTSFFFTPEMRAKSMRALQLENALRRALDRQQFTLHYQPQICIRSGEVRGVEALLRWQHPELGSISPAEFIPIAEDCGQILPIGEWVLKQAVAQLQLWRNLGIHLPTIAVNLSAVQFRQPNLSDQVARILEEVQLPAHFLELELTEGVAMDDPRSAIATMDQLATLGVRLSMDDFGTGYSSLSQLKRFPLYKLKIDQSFVKDLDGDSNDDRAIVSAIIRMAQALGMVTTAEGVETIGQLEFLENQGCTEAQGYYCGRPTSAKEMTEMLISPPIIKIKSQKHYFTN